MPNAYRYVGIGRENPFKTPAAAAKYIDVIGESLTPYRGYRITTGVQSQALIGKSATREGARGGIVFPVRPDNITNILKSVMGAVTSTIIGATTAYTHVFKMADDLLSLTLRVGKELGEEIYAGCVTDSLALSGAADDNLQASVGIIGAQKPTTGAIGTPNFSALQTFPYQQNVVTLGGAAFAVCEGFVLQVNRSIDDFRVCGDLTLPRIKPQNRMVSGRMVLDFADTTQRDIFLADTELANLRFKFEGGAIPAAPASKYTFDILLPKLWYVAYPGPNLRGRARLQATADFGALYDVTNTELMITVINEETTIA